MKMVSPTISSGRAVVHRTATDYRIQAPSGSAGRGFVVLFDLAIPITQPKTVSAEALAAFQIVGLKTVAMNVLIYIFGNDARWSQA
jgi:hypothetical protein